MREKTMLVSEAFEVYRRDVIQFRNQSPKTEENHMVACRSLINFIGDIPVEHLDFAMVRNWKEYLAKVGSANTVRGYIIKLRVVLAYLKDLKIETLDPNLVPIPKREEKVPVFLTPEQVSACIAATKRTKNKTIIAFLFASGLRISELCSLNRGQIHDRTFTVIGKGGKPRICFIDERTEGLLSQYLSTRTDNNPALFLNDGGTRLQPGTVQETFKTIRKQVGFECHPHALRHSFATALLNTNTNLFYVKQFMGHESLQTTQRYLHCANYDLRQVYEKHHAI